MSFSFDLKFRILGHRIRGHVETLEITLVFVQCGGRANYVGLPITQPPCLMPEFVLGYRDFCRQRVVEEGRKKSLEETYG